jgi:hypothetical protein
VAAGARRTAMLTQVATMWRTTHHLSFAFDRWFTHHTDHAAAAAAQTRQATADLRFWSCVRSSVHARSMGDWWLRWLRHVYGRHARKSSGANRGLKLVLRKRQEELDALKQRCSDCSNETTAAQAALADAETREQRLQQALMAAEHAQELAEEKNQWFVATVEKYYCQLQVAASARQADIKTIEDAEARAHTSEQRVHDLEAALMGTQKLHVILSTMAVAQRRRTLLRRTWQQFCRTVTVAGKEAHQASTAAAAAAHQMMSAAAVQVAEQRASCLGRQREGQRLKQRAVRLWVRHRTRSTAVARSWTLWTLKVQSAAWHRHNRLLHLQLVEHQALESAAKLQLEDEQKLSSTLQHREAAALAELQESQSQLAEAQGSVAAAQVAESTLRSTADQAEQRARQAAQATVALQAQFEKKAQDSKSYESQLASRVAAELERLRSEERARVSSQVLASEQRIAFWRAQRAAREYGDPSDYDPHSEGFDTAVASTQTWDDEEALPSVRSSYRQRDLQRSAAFSAVQRARKKRPSRRRQSSDEDGASEDAFERIEALEQARRQIALADAMQGLWLPPREATTTSKPTNAERRDDALLPPPPPPARSQLADTVARSSRRLELTFALRLVQHRSQAVDVLRRWRHCCGIGSKHSRPTTSGSRNKPTPPATAAARRRHPGGGRRAPREPAVSAEPLSLVGQGAAMAGGTKGRLAALSPAQRNFARHYGLGAPGAAAALRDLHGELRRLRHAAADVAFGRRARGRARDQRTQLQAVLGAWAVLALRAARGRQPSGRARDGGLLAGSLEQWVTRRRPDLSRERQTCRARRAWVLARWGWRTAELRAHRRELRLRGGRWAVRRAMRRAMLAWALWAATRLRQQTVPPVADLV